MPVPFYENAIPVFINKQFPAGQNDKLFIVQYNSVLLI
jgi:hypothetical protein